MATIVINSPSQGHQPVEQQRQQLQHQHQQHPQISVAAIYSTGTKTYHRDPVDVFLDILKSLIRASKISHIRNAAKITTPALCRRYVAVLCRYGLMIEVKTTEKNVLTYRNRTTGKRGSKIIRRYYITPKGNMFIRVYDAMVEELTNSFLR